MKTNTYLIAFSQNGRELCFSGSITTAESAKHAVHYYWLALGEHDDPGNIDLFCIEYNEENDSARICYDDVSAVAIKIPN